MNHNKLISKLDNGILLTSEEAKYLIDVLEMKDDIETMGDDFTWYADIAFFSLLTAIAIVSFALGAYIL